MNSHFEPDAARTGPLALLLFGLVFAAVVVAGVWIGVAR